MRCSGAGLQACGRDEPGRSPGSTACQQPGLIARRSRTSRRWRSSSAARCAAVCAPMTRARARAAVSARSRSGSSRSRRSVSRGESLDEDFAARHEERLEARPGIADDGHAAGGGLEQANARRPAGPNHVGARHVQREPLRGVEVAMARRRHVDLALDIERPPHVVRVLRAGDDEASLRPPARGLEHEAIEHGLPIVAVGSEVPEIPARSPPRRESTSRGRTSSAALARPATRTRARGAPASARP